jgi:glycosyltransferase involved in cell wall biosynthesis
MGKIKILFNAWADKDNTNAQSLNARDIAVRLDPRRFSSAFFALGEPKPELKDKPQIKIIKIPGRLGSLVMAAQMAWGSHDLIYYPPFRRQKKLFKIFNLIGKKKKTVFPVEATAQQILATNPGLRKEALQALFSSEARYAIGHNIAETVEEEFGLKLQVIPLGVDTKAFTVVSRTNHTLPVKIITLATMQPRKQTHLILDLAQHIKLETAEFHIFGNVLGDPAYYSRLLKQKATKSLTNVYFHDKVLHSDLPAVLQDFDIMVLPSRLEGVPRITLEAAATGMPCVIFADYRSPSVVDGVTGFQVYTFEEMVARVRLLVNDPDLRREMGASASEHVRQYDWELSVKLLERYFISLVSGESVNNINYS